MKESLQMVESKKNKKANSKPQQQEEDWESASDEESKDGQQPESLGTKSATILYDILNVPKTATPVEIKKAYRKLAL